MQNDAYLAHKQPRCRPEFTSCLKGAVSVPFALSASFCLTVPNMWISGGSDFRVTLHDSVRSFTQVWAFGSQWFVLKIISELKTFNFVSPWQLKWRKRLNLLQLEHKHTVIFRVMRKSQKQNLAEFPSLSLESPQSEKNAAQSEQQCSPAAATPAFHFHCCGDLEKVDKDLF